jgi:signal recognition particle GTPase
VVVLAIREEEILKEITTVGRRIHPHLLLWVLEEIMAQKKLNLAMPRQNVVSVSVSVSVNVSVSLILCLYGFRKTVCILI